jgi:hypothetical protein
MDIDITTPPLEKRMGILNEYNKAIKFMGFEHAARAYRNSMQNLYEKYNPHLAKIRKWKNKDSEDY